MPPQLYRFKLERATIAVFDDWMSTASTHDGDCFLGKMMVIVWDGLYSSPTTLFWHGVRSEWIERHDMFTVREGVTYA